MKLQGRIPVEPLDDERLTNIERRIVASAVPVAAVHPPRRAHWVALGVAALVAAGAIGWRIGARPGERVEVVAAEAPSTLTVATGAEGSTFDIGDATIASTPGTDYRVTRPDGGVLVSLARGRVELQVGKRGDRPPLVVRAGDTDVIVVGTKFSVDFGDGTGEADVRVTEGIVRVVRHGHEVRVAANQQSLARGGGDGAVVALATTIGDIAPHQADEGIEIDEAAAPTLRDHTAAVPDAHEVRPTHAHATTGETAHRTEPGARTSPKPPPGPNADLIEAILALPMRPPLDVGAGSPDEALAAYRKIVFDQKGAPESQALYSIAALQASPAMGRTGDARSTLDGYFRRFLGRAPEYPELEPALWLNVRLACKKIDGTCRVAASSYLKHRPGGPGAHIAERITLGQ